MNKPKYMYVIIPMVEANGHSVGVAQTKFRQVCKTEEEAVEQATNMLDKRTYNSMYIYKAVIQVRRSAPPIEILPVTEE